MKKSYLIIFTTIIVLGLLYFNIRTYIKISAHYQNLENIIQYEIDNASRYPKMEI